MAIGLDDALLGWLVASAGDAVAAGLRDDPATRAMRQVVGQAAEVAVAEVAGHLDGHQAEHLRSSLLIRETRPGVGGVTVTSEADLRHALRAWTAALDHPEFDEPGYLSQLGVDAQLLADTLTGHIATGVQRNGRSGGALEMLATWLWRDGVTGHLARIEEKLDARVGTVEPVGGGLPGGTPDFTGRQQALVELAERVQAHDPAGTVVAIHAVDGMAGVGKTELALRAAHQHKHRYPDGQYFINLHGYTEGVPPMPPLAALEELLRQAGVPGPAIPADLAGRHSRWQALMATRRALVLLDNALDIDQVSWLLPNAAGCLVLITSRTRLRGLPGAKALPLDVLPPAEAVELFIRLVDVGRQLDQDAVVRVVLLVGRLPVAVQAVAGQVDDSYTEAELADDLAEAKAGLALVDQAGPLGAGVRVAFETSIRRLDHAHQQAFRILGVHPGPSIGLPQFAALAALPIQSAHAMLRGLANRNLIMASHGRVGHHHFELHDLMREFARQQAASYLSEEEHAAAIARLTTWYLAAMNAVARLRDAAGSEPAESGVKGLDLDRPAAAHLWMGAEQDNLLAYAEAATGAAAAHVCQQAARNLSYLSYYTTAQALYHAAATFYHQAGDRGGEANARLGQGEVARATGDYPDAVMHYRAAQGTLEEIGDRGGEADAQRGLGRVARLTGDYPAAVEHFRAAQSTFEEIGDLRGEADGRRGLAHVAWLTGDYLGAVEHLRVARSICEEIGDRGGEAYTRRGQGEVAWLTGDYPGAVEHYRAAQSTFEELGDRGGKADVQCGLGHVARLTGDYPGAVKHYRAAQSTCKEIGDRGGEADARWGLGQVALAAGDYPGAVEHLRAAQSTCQEIRHRDGEAAALWSLGDVANQQGRRDEARDLWQRAHAIFLELDSPHAESVRDRLAHLDLE